MRKITYKRSDIIKSKLSMIIQILIFCYASFYLYLPIDILFNNHQDINRAMQNYICVRIK